MQDFGHGTHGTSEDQQSMLRRGCGVSALLGHLKWCKISSINSSTSTSTNTNANTNSSTSTGCNHRAQLQLTLKRGPGPDQCVHAEAVEQL